MVPMAGSPRRGRGPAPRPRALQSPDPHVPPPPLGGEPWGEAPLVVDLGNHHLRVPLEIRPEAKAQAPREIPHVGSEDDFLLGPGFVAIEKDREALARGPEDLVGIVGHRSPAL